jgi:alpha-glucosidase
VSRYARAEQHDLQYMLRHLTGAADLDLGARRARAALLLMAALPGSFYVYQGEEWGLPEVEDLPGDARQDPAWVRSGHTDPGRDGCRVPLPWSGDRAPFGFSPTDATAAPWLPQPEWFAQYTAERNAADPASMLQLYRDAIRMRREHTALGDGPFSWVSSGDDVVAFERTPEFVCVVNLGGTPVALPPHAAVLLASAPLVDGMLAGDAAVWLAR